MVKYSDDVMSLITLATEEALRKGHKNVTSLHFLWAVFHTPLEHSCVVWLERQGVDKGRVMEEFQNPELWASVQTSLDSVDEIEASRENEHEMPPLSPEFQARLELTAKLSDNGVVMASNFLFWLVYQGDSNVCAELLARCSETGKLLHPLPPKSEDDMIGEPPLQNEEPPIPPPGDDTPKTGMANNDGKSVTSKSSKSIRGSVVIRGIRTTRNSSRTFSDINTITSERTSETADRSTRQPQRYVHIEKGTSFLFLDETKIPKRLQGKLRPVDADGALIIGKDDDAFLARKNTEFFDQYRSSLQIIADDTQTSDIAAIQANNQVGFLGGAWRGALRRIIVFTADDANGLRYTRGLQLFVPFLTGYEAYLLDEVIRTFDNQDFVSLGKVLKAAFQNRNVSRILNQQMTRYDILWHWSTQFRWNRLFDAWGQVPFIGFGSFPATENFPSSRNHALASIFRVALGKGSFFSRLLTSGREEIQTDNADATAQNLAAESNGFELANRNQYGTYFGRKKTNAFRLAHRLPTDESIVRTFIAQPASTINNNGFEHTIRQVAKHWHNILYQPSGNFAHQRMEQIDPFETLRFHMPIVLLKATTLRGLNAWDSLVLAPFIKKLQSIRPCTDPQVLHSIVEEFRNDIVVMACGGIGSRIDPLMSWLNAIENSIDMLFEEAMDVYRIVSAVEMGLRLGYDVISKVEWKVPSDSSLRRAVLQILRSGPASINEMSMEIGAVRAAVVRRALNLLSPKDKRTLIELVNKGYVRTRPANLLLGRAITLLKREIRRDTLSQKIRELSIGLPVDEFAKKNKYWLVNDYNHGRVYFFADKRTGKKEYKFYDRLTGHSRWIRPVSDDVIVKTYIPVAESIIKAQKAFMKIELDHGKKFSYNAFMEVSFLRAALRKLTVIAQTHCEELDDARLNILSEIQRVDNVQISIRDLEPGKAYYMYEKKQYVTFECSKKYTAEDPEWEDLKTKKFVKIPPQSMIVIGGGPTGLLTVLHNAENVITSGGEIRLKEARDAFAKGGATFERSQIVRLDSRWIVMLRYHLGSIYENVFIPASGETDSHLGNTLPTQGFVEITIKDLEDMLQLEVSRMDSKGIVRQDTQSTATYNVETNKLQKLGKALKENDLLQRRVDRNGKVCKDNYTWRVTKIEFNKPLESTELVLGSEYEILVTDGLRLCAYQLVSVNVDTKVYQFKPLDDNNQRIEVTADNLPTIYPRGTKNHSEIQKVRVECVEVGDDGRHVVEDFDSKAIEKKSFSLETGHTHVVECIGKKHGSKTHFSVTTGEPYGVCCIGGLKISLGMHSFGNKRWGQGIVDDIRSQADQNTRVVGDFTKDVSTAKIAKMMQQLLAGKKDSIWILHFKKIVDESGIKERLTGEPIIPKLQKCLLQHSNASKHYRRHHLQVRFFETGDNYYLGMEFTREYDAWKKATVDNVVAPAVRIAAVHGNTAHMDRSIKKLKRSISHGLDRLWFESALETIRTADVYNPSGQSRIPHLYLIDSLIPTRLSKLPVGESFHVANDETNERYEVMIKNRFPGRIVVRNVEGHISTMGRGTTVYREGNLTRGPDGRAESKVALDTFPVSHYVNYRTMRLNDEEKGYVFAFIGDEQSTPHFMRYSGLTGACINAMLFNNLIDAAIEGRTFTDRCREYSMETHWSNGEVVQRGTGANYGEDGFLRPGFSYSHGLDYLYSKAIEYKETGQFSPSVDLLSRDWKIKFAASLVPRGLETNRLFLQALKVQLRKAIVDHVLEKTKKDEAVDDLLYNALADSIQGSNTNSGENTAREFWEGVLGSMIMPVATTTNKDDTDRLRDYHIAIALSLEESLLRCIEYSESAFHRNERISSESCNQPKSVDFITDDFAVEAQNFANSLTTSATLAAAALASQVFTNAGSALLSAMTPIIAFGTIANVSRYKSRNEASREEFFDERYLPMLMVVFCQLSPEDQGVVPLENNPFFIDINSKTMKFLDDVQYYNRSESPTEFLAAYDELKGNFHDQESLGRFMHLLATKFIVDTFHVNSYVQESLVDIYTATQKMMQLVHQPLKRQDSQFQQTYASQEARILFERMVIFGKRLESTLQRGEIKYGFYKKNRSIGQWNFFTIFTYLWDKICCPRKNMPDSVEKAQRTSRMKLISTETAEVLAWMKILSEKLTKGALGREMQELRLLHDATTESYVSSLIISQAYIAFFTGILFTIGNILGAATSSPGVDVIMRIGSWSFGVFTPFTAILSMLFLWRKTRHLFVVNKALRKKLKQNPPRSLNNSFFGSEQKGSSMGMPLKKIRRVTKAQIWNSIMRFLASALAVVALPWALVARESALEEEDEEKTIDSNPPFYLALVSLGLQIASILFLMIIEYRIRFNLDPNLGQVICDSFAEEITTIRNDQFPTRARRASSDPLPVQARNTWEYIAREFLHQYRFDTVFAADRFGSIYHYFQPGMYDAQGTTYYKTEENDKQIFDEDYDEEMGMKHDGVALQETAP